MRARSILGLALSHFTIVQSFERTASSLCHWRKGAESQTPTLTRGSIIVARGRELLSHLTNRVLVARARFLKESVRFGSQEAEANMRLLEQNIKSGSAALHRKHVSLFATIPCGGQPTTSLDPVRTAWAKSIWRALTINYDQMDKPSFPAPEADDRHKLVVPRKRLASDRPKTRKA